MAVNRLKNRIKGPVSAMAINSAIQVDMGEPPLQLRRLQQQLLYAAKVKSTHDHPTRKVFEGHWAIRWGKYNGNTAPI